MRTQFPPRQDSNENSHSSTHFVDPFVISDYQSDCWRTKLWERRRNCVCCSIFALIRVGGFFRNQNQRGNKGRKPWTAVRRFDSAPSKADTPPSNSQTQTPCNLWLKVLQIMKESEMIVGTKLQHPILKNYNLFSKWKIQEFGKVTNNLYSDFWPKLLCRVRLLLNFLF